jgi:predicted transposase
MKLTAKVKLQPTKEQAELLKQTLETANAACNWMSDQAWRTKTFGQFKLHKLVYAQAREQFNYGKRNGGNAVALFNDQDRREIKARNRRRDREIEAWENQKRSGAGGFRNRDGSTFYRK